MKYLKTYKLFENDKIESFERDAVNITLANAIDNNNIELMEGVYKEFAHILNPIFKEGLKVLARRHELILDTLNESALNKNDEVVKILINTKYVKKATQMSLEHLEILFVGGIGTEIDFDDNTIAWDSEHADMQTPTHFFSNSGSYYEDYNTNYKRFLEEVKDGNDCRIYTDHDEDEDFINGFGDLPG